MIETPTTDRPMPDIARATVNAMHDGHDVELPVAAWRRPGLTRAINAELAARGPGRGLWRFVEPAHVVEEGPEVEDILGWGGPPARATAPQPAPPVPEPASAAIAPERAVGPRHSVIAPAFVDLDTTVAVVPAYMDLPVTPTPVPVRLPVAAQPPSTSTVPPIRRVQPARPVTLLTAGPPPQVTGMLIAAYAVVAHAQPVMAANLRPAAFGQLTHGVPATLSSRATALAELADLENL